MEQPLLTDVAHESDSADKSGSSNVPALDSGVAQATEPHSVWKPIMARVVLSGLALLGLAGVGAASMLAGLDGARANAPQVAASPSHQSATNSAPASDSAKPAASGTDAAPPASAASQAQSATPCGAGRTADGKVILNSATIADLRTLPGIGQKRADAILALRDKLKRFRRIQELRRVRGIGAKSLMKLAPKLLVDPPAGMCISPAQ